MCGRYVLKTSTPELARMFGADRPPPPPGPEPAASTDITSFNIAPTQTVIVCRRDAGGHPALRWMRWGLVPRWSKDERSAARMINARAETLTERPAFRDAFRRRRCLVPASGFFEWQRAGRLRQPYLFSMRSGTPFAFAGLWEQWRNPSGEDLYSCTIVTTDANRLVAHVHDRMPVILPPESYRTWLATDEYPPGAVAPLLAPFPAEAMRAYPVSTLVNHPGNDDPRCMEPLGDLLESV